MISAKRVHPFPFRTRKLSSAAATILGGRLPGKIAHRELKLVISAQRVHPFPFRTRKLSSVAATILGGRLPGKIAHCQHNMFFAADSFWRFLRFVYIFSSLAQSVERVTVNHDVVGSSPTGGAIKMLQKSNLAKNP